MRKRPPHLLRLTCDLLLRALALLVNPSVVSLLTHATQGIKTIICNRTGWWLSLLVSVAVLYVLSIPIRAELRDRERPRLPLSTRDHLK
jgi:putative effector of murein hydrolase LrgA (UPF0299 family)